MDPNEVAAGSSLAMLVVAVAAFFAWRQVRTFRLVRHDPALAPADRRFLRQQALRRLINSLLMLAFAGLLVGGLFLFPPVPGGDQGPAVPDDTTRASIRIFTGYWIMALFVLLAILTLAVVDLWATARFGFRHQQQLEQDRKAMLAEEAARLRQRGQNGHFRAGPPSPPG